MEEKYKIISSVRIDLLPCEPLQIVPKFEFLRAMKILDEAHALDWST